MNTQQAFYPAVSAQPPANRSLPAQPEPSGTRALGRVTSLGPIAGMLGGAVLLASDRGRARRFGVAALGASLGLAFARWQWGRAFNWQPPYRVEQANGRLEIRRYGRELHAETTIHGATWDEALELGFRTLADYISGNNVTGLKIPMTSPVMITLYEPTPRRLYVSWRAPAVGPVDALNGPA